MCAIAVLFAMLFARQSHSANRSLRALVLLMSEAGWVGVEEVREATGTHVTRWQFSLLVRQLEGEGLVESRPWPVVVGKRQASSRKCRRLGGGR
jgi:hypothetical protein